MNNSLANFLSFLAGAGLATLALLQTQAILRRNAEYWHALYVKADTEKSELFHKILKRINTMSQELETLIGELNTNTNAVADRLERLVTQIEQAGQAPTPQQLETLRTIANHLKALGADTSNPVPDVPADDGGGGTGGTDVPPAA